MPAFRSMYESTSSLWMPLSLPMEERANARICWDLCLSRTRMDAARREQTKAANSGNSLYLLLKLMCDKLFALVLNNNDTMSPNEG